MIKELNALVYSFKKLSKYVLNICFIQNAFGGIRVCVCVLIANAVVKLYKKAIIDVPTLLIYLLVTLGSIFISVSPVVFVIFAAVAGILLNAMGGKKK